MRNVIKFVPNQLNVCCSIHCRRAGKLLGEGGLEVRCHGARPTLPVDLHAGSPRRHGGNHPTSAFALRRPRAHRQATVGDIQHGSQSTPAEQESVLRIAYSPPADAGCCCCRSRGPIWFVCLF